RFFRPYQESSQTGMRPRLVVRAVSDPRLVIPAVRRALKGAGPDMMEPEIQVARQVLHDSTRAHRIYRNYLLVFASVALLLAAIGLYGVLAYVVARRGREIGVRLALGAHQRHIMELVIGKGMLLVGLGVLIGTIASFWLTR